MALAEFVDANKLGRIERVLTGAKTILEANDMFTVEDLVRCRIIMFLLVCFNFAL